jgi:hypothetical protein
LFSRLRTTTRGVVKCEVLKKMQEVIADGWGYLPRGLPRRLARRVPRGLPAKINAVNYQRCDESSEHCPHQTAVTYCTLNVEGAAVGVGVGYTVGARVGAVVGPGAAKTARTTLCGHTVLPHCVPPVT